MEDKILQMFFSADRWEYAIEKGVGKEINRADLYLLTKPEVRVPVDPDDGIIEDDTVILIANGYSEAEVWIEELKPI